MIFVLVGMPACGKSCMGRAISRKLGLKNIDSDKLIERKYNKKLFELIAEYGIDGFKRIEEEVLLSVNEDNIILSTGGSAIYYSKAMEHLKTLGYIVYLYCSYDVIKERLGDFSKRGVVLREGQTLLDLYNERCKLYEKYADVTIDCNGTSYAKYQARVVSSIRWIMSETQNSIK